jgi:hypothetical protein
MSAGLIQGDFRVTGDIRRGGDLLPDVPRDNLEIESGKVIPVPLTWARVWDAINSNLPAAGGTDDLGITGGTWATHAPKLTTGDVKAAGCTRRARLCVPVPKEYVDGETFKLRLSAGMETTVADTSATVDIEAFQNGRDGTIDGADLCTTAAQSINTLGFADKDFTINPAGLSAGDELDVRITITIVDGATATAVIGSVGMIERVCDIRG